MQRLAKLLLPARLTTRNYASTAEGKSMLDSAVGRGASNPTQLLGSAAEAQMQKIKSKIDSDTASASESTSPVRKALRILGKTILYGMLGAGTAVTYYQYAYETKDLLKIVEQTRKPENAFQGSEMWTTVMKLYLGYRIGAENAIKQYTDPTYHKLLPDMAPELRGRIKTLVLDLNDLLVHKEWTRQKGWQIYKRPGVQDFLYEMGQYFEIVIYTDEPNTYTDPILERLDTHRVIPYRLYRPETQYHEGMHVRDLSKLNRDLSQVLFISADDHAYAFQPENTLKLKKWKKDVEDKTLLDLIPMLQMIATRGIRDVRDVVKAYDGEDDIAAAFRHRMTKIEAQNKPAKKKGFLRTGL